MDLALAPAEEAARARLAELLDEHAPIAVVRAAEPLGYAPGTWAALHDAGVAAWGVADDGPGLVGLAAAAREGGRRVAPVPLPEHWSASRLVVRAGHAVDHAAPTALALAPAAHGRARLVPAGAVAPRVVALDGTDLVLVGPPDALPASPRNTGCAALADRAVHGDAAGPRVVLDTGAGAHDLHGRAVDEWRVLTAAALAGVGRRALELAVERVRHRHQFGVPIGSFQAVQHRLADVVTALDGSDLLVSEAAWAADAEPGRGPALAAMALVAATDAARAATAAALQLHGGYGYTLEHDVQLYYRRAKAWPLALGDPHDQLGVVADRLWPREAR